MPLINMGKTKGPRCFVQVGVYLGRNKRSKSVFRVVEGVDVEALKVAIQNAVNALEPVVTK